MGITQVLFWFLSILALLSAILVVISKNPVHSVLWLIIVFVAISGHYIVECAVPGDREPDRLRRSHYGLVPFCVHADEPECGYGAAEEQVVEDRGGCRGGIAIAGVGCRVEEGGSEDADRGYEYGEYRVDP